MNMLWYRSKLNLSWIQILFDARVTNCILWFSNLDQLYSLHMLPTVFFDFQISTNCILWFSNLVFLKSVLVRKWFVFGSSFLLHEFINTQSAGNGFFLQMWIWRVKGIIFTESADHFKFDFYPSTWHIPFEYLHPWGVLSPVTLKNVQNECICGEFEG